MMRYVFIALLLLISIVSAHAQPLSGLADSLRMHYAVPELCYAVVSADSILESGYYGYRRNGTALRARAEDRFRIGSNTKAITAAIASQLVSERRITWDTKFLDLYPELRQNCDTAYLHITLIDLLDMKVPFSRYTYTDKKPTRKQITHGRIITPAEERQSFVKWFLTHAADKHASHTQLSNVSYTAAGMMLERATGISYQDLVHAFGKKLHIEFDFGDPALHDSTQTYGHTDKSEVRQPADSYKLNWLLAAGNINVTLPDYIKFIQSQIKALPPTLSKDRASSIEGRQFSMGWLWELQADRIITYHNLGNPGSFTTAVYVIPSIDRAYIIFTNSQNDNTYQAASVLLDAMKTKYGY